MLVSSSLKILLVMSVLGIFSGCSRVVSSVTGGLSQSMAQAILNENDPQLVAEGVPTYLLMLDGFLEHNPESEDTLLAAAKLYGAYGGTFVKDPARAKKMTDKARTYALRGACLSTDALCGVETLTFPLFEERISRLREDDIDAAYILGTTWVGWIQTHSADWNAVADIAKAKALLKWVARQDAGHDQGGVSLYLGALATILPPALGGHPEEGKDYFDKALEASEGRNLMVKVLYAERYARTVFDRELHDRLLKEVLAAKPEAEGLTLMNTLAQERAQQLLDDANSYF